MLATLISQTTPNTGFSAKGLLVILIFFAIAYPLQKKFRESVSRRRKERWAREGLIDVNPPEPAPSGQGEEPPGGEASANEPSDRSRPDDTGPGGNGR